MISRFKSFVMPVTMAASLAVMMGCAGSKSSSSMDSRMGAESEKSQKLEDARRSAEDAEAKAHQLREEKNSSTAKNDK